MGRLASSLGQPAAGPPASAPATVLTARPAPPPPTCCAAYGLTLVWAFVAVFEKTVSAPVRHAALAAIVVLAVLSIASVLRAPGREPRHAGGDHDARQPLRPSLDEP